MAFLKNYVAVGDSLHDCIPKTTTRYNAGTGLDTGSAKQYKAFRSERPMYKPQAALVRTVSGAKS